MCLILVAWQQHAEFPLVVSANRDEFHARPAERAGFWKDHPSILGGRDLEAKGTWMGVSRSGRFAAVTNYRGGQDANAKESRGALVTRFLLSSSDSGAFMETTEKTRNSFSGFNLLVADREELWWLSNRDGGTRKLAPGFYALGNLLLDTPEVMEVKSRFKGAALAIESQFALLATAKIVAPGYGTRCSTVLLAQRDGGIRFAERAFDPTGADGSTLRYELPGTR
jgi:uncharacterized protein with NRDE domain